MNREALRQWRVGITFVFCFLLQTAGLLTPSTQVTCRASSDPSLVQTAPVHTIFGPVTNPEPVILELIQHPVMQRLKEVDQFGPPAHHGYLPKLSRYDHSLGVYYLVQYVGAPVREQVAALLHDASHTAFSHVADVVFQGNAAEDLSFQDENHVLFLGQMGVGHILEKYGLTLEGIDPHTNEHAFKALEQDLPDLCADRIEYNLHTGVVMGLLTDDDVIQILADLHFKDGVWFFDTPDSAKKLAQVSLYSTVNMFNTYYNAALYNWYAAAIKRAIDTEHLHVNDFVFGTDKGLLKKLAEVKDPMVQGLLDRAKDVENNVIVSYDPKPGYDYVWTTKFRGIDPLVLQGNQLKRLTAIDAAYANLYTEAKTIVNQSLYLRNKIS